MKPGIQESKQALKLAFTLASPAESWALTSACGLQPLSIQIGSSRLRWTGRLHPQEKVARTPTGYAQEQREPRVKISKHKHKPLNRVKPLTQRAGSGENSPYKQRCRVCRCWRHGWEDKPGRTSFGETHVQCPPDFPGGPVVKNPPASAGGARYASSIPGSGRSPGGANGNTLKYSCLPHFWTGEPRRLQPNKHTCEDFRYWPYW